MICSANEGFSEISFGLRGQINDYLYFLHNTTGSNYMGACVSLLIQGFQIHSFGLREQIYDYLYFLQNTTSTDYAFLAYKIYH